MSKSFPSTFCTNLDFCNKLFSLLTGATIISATKLYRIRVLLCILLAIEVWGKKKRGKNWKLFFFLRLQHFDVFGFESRSFLGTATPCNAHTHTHIREQINYYISPIFLFTFNEMSCGCVEHASDLTKSSVGQCLLIAIDWICWLILCKYFDFVYVNFLVFYICVLIFVFYF